MANAKNSLEKDLENKIDRPATLAAADLLGENHEKDVEVNDYTKRGGRIEQPKRNRLPEPLEKIAKDSFLRMKELRNLSNSLPAMAGVVWIEVKDEIECLDNRLHQLDTTLTALQRANCDLRLKMADERALFETLAGFNTLPPRGKEIVSSSYFTLVLTDLKRRMQNLSGRVNQLLNMQKPKDKMKSTSQAVLLRSVIVKNQEILRATAAKMYSIHEQISQLAQHLGVTELDATHQLSDKQQDSPRIRIQGLRNNDWTYASFPGQPLQATFNSVHSPCALYEGQDTGPPPLEPVTGLALFGATGDRHLPIPGPRTSVPTRFDDETIHYIGLPDLSQLHFVTKDAFGQKPIKPIYEIHSSNETPTREKTKATKPT